MSDDHGPQRQPASVPQIEAQMKQVNGELRLDYFRSLLRENTSLREENERLRERLESVSAEIHRQIRLCLDVLAKPKWTKRAEHTIETLARVLAKLEQQHQPEHDGTGDCSEEIARRAMRIHSAGTQDEIDRLRKQVGVAVDFLAEIVTSGVEFEDERIGYKVLQVPNSLLADAEVWLKAMKGEDTDDTH